MNKRSLDVFGLLAIILLVVACGNNTQESFPPQSTGHRHIESLQNNQDKALVSNKITGKVLETIDSGGYTYMQIDRSGEKLWIAVPKTSVKIGDKVSVIQQMSMKNFKSKTLGRTFDEIIFASTFPAKGHNRCPAGSTKPLNNETPTPESMQCQAMGSGKAIVPFQNVKVKKAKGENSYTIANLFEKKVELNGKRIKVRGKVVKVLQNIMGRNWIHLQDGTGNPADNTHDLVVTSSSVPEKDSVISVNGTLAADKDFGFGYQYVVIIEDAKIIE